MRPYKPPVTVCKKIKCIDCRRNIVLMGIVKNFQEHGWRVRAARSLFVTFWVFFFGRHGLSSACLLDSFVGCSLYRMTASFIKKECGRLNRKLGRLKQ